MKKIMFMAATAALVLGSCSNEELVDATPEGTGVTEGAVTFEAYSARETRASVTDLNTVKGLGFGVFAYDQGTASYLTYSASNTQPNFFYNQKVKYGDAIATWTMKATVTPEEWATLSSTEQSTYYNDTPTAGVYRRVVGGENIADGSISDAAKALATPATFTGTGWNYAPIKFYNNNKNALHSFFAYAPYNQSVKTVFTNSKAPQIRYTAGVDNYDLMWGEQWDGEHPLVDVKKPSVTEKIGFNFKHALSRVTIKAAPFIDDVHGNSVPSVHPEHLLLGTLAKYTKVTLRSVKFVGTNLPSQGLLNLQTGLWTIEETDENAYELATSTVWDATDSELPITTRETIQDDMMIIPTGESNKFQIQVVYDVTTVDGTNPKNNSTVTNTIISSAEEAEKFALEAGVAYEFHLDLGMTSVKFDAKVVDWNLDKDVDVDLPNNKLEELSSTNLGTLPTTITPAAWKGKTNVAPLEAASNDFYYDMVAKDLYMCTVASSAGTPATWVQQIGGKKYIYNSEIYTATDNTPVYNAPYWWYNGTKFHRLEDGVYVAKTLNEDYDDDDTDDVKAFWAALNASSLTSGNVYKVGLSSPKYYYIK